MKKPQCIIVVSSQYLTLSASFLLQTVMLTGYVLNYLTAYIAHMTYFKYFILTISSVFFLLLQEFPLQANSQEIFSNGFKMDALHDTI